MKDAPPIIVITGPTAVGKSKLALEVAELLGGEIVSADSMQVYRHLDIGTAKPTLAERARIPHHLVDFVDLRDAYSAGRYMTDASAAVADIASRGRVPIVCGGTALYLRALLHGLAPGAPRDEIVRARLAAAWEEGERERLWRELERVDPLLAGRLHPNDRSRILRGLEVWRVSGRPLSSHQARHGFRQSRFAALHLGVAMDRPLLYRRIDARVVAMFEAGWIEEVRAVLDAGYPPSLPPLQAIGYKEIVGFLLGAGDGRDAVVSEIQKKTRRFAKRQLTWFRSMPLEWVSSDRAEEVASRARKFLQTGSQTI